MQLLKTKKCCGCMDLRTGGLVIGYLSLFGAFINLEAPNAMGIGPFGMYLLFCQVVFSFISWIYSVFICFSGKYIGVRCLDLWHHQCKCSGFVVSFWRSKTPFRLKWILNFVTIKPNPLFFSVSACTETNQLDATGIDSNGHWNGGTFAKFNVDSIIGHGIPWRHSILFKCLCWRCWWGNTNRWLCVNDILDNHLDRYFCLHM